MKQFPDTVCKVVMNGHLITLISFNVKCIEDDVFLV